MHALVHKWLPLLFVCSLLCIVLTAMRPQEWAYSCELASLVNALDGIGISIDEAFIRAQVPIDTRPRGVDQFGRSAWADPHKVIVGDIRRYGLSNGISYGVFPRPMARAARAAGAHALAVSDMSIDELRSYAEFVPTNIGIEVWGTVGGGRRLDGWYADDRWIAVTADPHVYHVVRIADDGIVLGDPYTVQERFFTWARFEAMWTHQAVLVRHDSPWTQTIAPTPFAVDGLFLELFRSEGGVAAFGLPLGASHDEAGRRVQYFERAVMEAHPEMAGTPAEVQLRLLGTQLHGIAPPVAAALSVLDRRFFGETGHTLAPPFLHYWEQHGGRAIFGLPITEPTVIDNRNVQWFERARLEIQPDGSIVRGLVGRESFDMAVPSPEPAPTPHLVMPDLAGWGETQAREHLTSLGITDIIVDYQGRAEVGELFDQIAPYVVVSHVPASGTPLSESSRIVLGVRAP